MTMPIKNRVKRFIDSRGISVYRFVKETGIAPNTAYKLYKDPRHLPAPNVLEAICDRYKVQPGELIYWTTEE